MRVFDGASGPMAVDGHRFWAEFQLRSTLFTLRTEVAEPPPEGEQLATRKSLDRAKGVLQQQLGLSEPEAFRWIQKTSMDRRLSMREVAETIINQVN